MWAGWSHEPSCCGCGPHNAHSRPYCIPLVYCARASCTCRATPWLGKGHGDGRAVLGVRSGARVRELLGPPCGGGLTRVRPSARGGDVCVFTGGPLPVSVVRYPRRSLRASPPARVPPRCSFSGLYLSLQSPGSRGGTGRECAAAASCFLKAAAAAWAYSSRRGGSLLC